MQLYLLFCQYVPSNPALTCRVPMILLFRGKGRKSTGASGVTLWILEIILRSSIWNIPSIISFPVLNLILRHSLWCLMSGIYINFLWSFLRCETSLPPTPVIQLVGQQVALDWCWLVLIDADWCWLMLIDVDWHWLMLILKGGASIRPTIIFHSAQRHSVWIYGINWNQLF